MGMVEAAYQPGIVVGSLNQATPGAKAALHRGDVIVNIDGEPLRGRSGDVTIVKNAIVYAPAGCCGCCLWTSPCLEHHLW